MAENSNKNLISIDEVIKRARERGVDFGNGNPKNRLRYLVKVGLLPHAQRKRFGKKIPEGAYPENVVDLLVEIDKEIKAGKTIQQIKEEFEKNKTDRGQTSGKFEFEDIEEKGEFPAKEISHLSKIALPIFIAFIIFIIVGAANFKSRGFSELLAQLKLPKEFVQIIPQEQIPPEKTETFPSRKFPFLIEPYLTINAPTDIMGPLTVKEKISTPLLVFQTEAFSGNLKVGRLSADREYILPDASGTICLSTGNCIGLGGEIFGTGILNRLSKFGAPNRLISGSILDLFSGIALTIDAFGNIGIGTQTPTAKLEVVGGLKTSGDTTLGANLFVSGNSRFLGQIFGEKDLSILGSAFVSGSITGGDITSSGRIRAVGDICTDLAGGKCLSQAITVLPPIGGGGGVGGAGTPGYLPIWTGARMLGNSLLYQFDNKIGIGTASPNEILTIGGVLSLAKTSEPDVTLGFGKLYVGDNGRLYFKTENGIVFDLLAPTGTIPGGTLAGQTLRWDGISWVPSSFLYNTDSFVGIGTTTNLATLAVAGSAYFLGPLTLKTSNLPQLLLKLDDNNYLQFSITSTSSEILASKILKLNSLTGEIKILETSLKRGDKIIRASIPIFKYEIPSQTNSTSFVAISKKIAPSELSTILPSQLEGSQRKFAFLINFADNIPPTASSTFLIDFDSVSDVSFEFSGQNLSSLDEGKSHLKGEFSNLLSDSWTLKAKVPNQVYSLRVFNLFLLVYDEIQ